MCLSRKIITFQEGSSLTPFDDTDVMVIMEVVDGGKDEKSK